MGGQVRGWPFWGMRIRGGMLVGLKANMDSGDEGRSDGDLNTFNALDPRFA